MSAPTRLAPSTMSPQPLYGAGRPPDPSTSKSSLPVIDDTSSRKTIQSLPINPPSAVKRRSRPNTSTVESRQASKSKISKDRSSFYLTNTPHTKLSKISDPDSTGKDPDCCPFWNEQWRDEYQKWSLPAKTASVALPSSSSPSFSNDTAHKSWFSTSEINPQSTRSEKTFSPSCKYSLVDGTGSGATKSNGLAVKKIRCYPNPQQKQMLAKMAGTTRFLFNHVISMIRDKVLPFETKEAKAAKLQQRKTSFLQSGVEGEYKETQHPWLNFMYMRNFLVNNQTVFVQQHPWMKEIPNSVRQVAVKEAISNHKACLTNLSAGNVRSFKSPFRRKKNRSWSIGFDPKQLKLDKLLPSSSFGRLKVAERRHLRPTYKSQIRITRDQNLRYWLILIDSKRNDQNRTEESSPIMSVDPGVRTRHTVFSTRGGGCVHEFGRGDIQRIVRIAKHIDQNISESTKVNHTRRRKLLKHRLKMKFKIENLKREMDYQIINFFRNNASKVLLPDFKVHNMACRLRSKTARSLLCWGHGLFKQRLVEVAAQCHLQIMIVTEHYTSKTCGNCGRLNQSLGGKKHFQCSACGFSADRDHNGARNILLRALRKAH